MSLVTQRLIAFLMCAAIGCGLSAILANVVRQRLTIPAVDLIDAGQIEEITMDVSDGWWTSRDYKIVFQRRGPSDYYSSATRIWVAPTRLEYGTLSRAEFDRLANAIQAQGFFELNSRYPENSLCKDCLITNVSVFRGGQRRRVKTYTADIPSQLWAIQRMLEGMSTQVQWLKD